MTTSSTSCQKSLAETAECSNHYRHLTEKEEGRGGGIPLFCRGARWQGV
jgi:hypothetical protein